MVIVKIATIQQQEIIRTLLLSGYDEQVFAGLVMNHQTSPCPFPEIKRLGTKRKGKFLTHIISMKTTNSGRESRIRCHILTLLGICQGGFYQNDNFFTYQKKYKEFFPHEHWINSINIFQMLGYSYQTFFPKCLTGWDQFKIYCQKKSKRSGLNEDSGQTLLFTRVKLRSEAEQLIEKINSRLPKSFITSDLPF